MAGPAGERIFAAQPVQFAGARIIAAPFQFVTTGTDNIRVVSANSVVGVTLTIQGLRLDERGQVVPFGWAHTPNTDRSSKTENFAFGKGALLSLNVQASGGAPLIGQTYVTVRLIRGLAGATFVVGTLLAGHVTTTQSLGWPGSPIASSTSGEPAVREIFGTVPAVGNDVSESCPTGARWELMTVLAGLVTDATAGTRAAIFRQIATNGSSPLFVILNPAAGDVPPSSTYTFTWGQNIPPSFRNLFNVTPFPQRPLLRAGGRFTITGQNVGDQWVAIAYTVREWLEVP